LLWAIGFPAAEKRAEEKARQDAQRDLIRQHADQEAQCESEEAARYIRHHASMTRAGGDFKRASWRALRV